MIQVNEKINPRNVILHDGTSITYPNVGMKSILFFYPKDNTPGCTAEACSIRDYYKELKDLGYELYGVSVDSTKSHLKFIEKYELPYPLISDEEKILVQELGLWIKKKFMGREYMGTARTTLVLDETGTVTHVLDTIDTKNAGKQLLELLQSENS